MKKILLMAFSMVLLLSCMFTVFAEEAQYSDAGELYMAWAEDLPDYICGIWSTDGGMTNLTFGIQDNEAGNAGKEKMLELIEDDSTVTFVYQKYSRNYLMQIQKELDHYMELDLGLISTGVYDIQNYVEFGILQEKKDKARTKAMIEEIFDKYGDAVAVKYTGEIYTMTLMEEKTNHTVHVAFFTASFAVLAFVCILFFVRKNRGTQLQTENGAIVVSTKAPTYKEVEALVKKSTIPPPSDLDQKVLRNISKNK